MSARERRASASGEALCASGSRLGEEGCCPGIKNPGPAERQGYGAAGERGSGGGGGQTTACSAAFL